MSDTLTNSGPLETGKIPSEDTIKDNQITDKEIPALAPSTLSAPVDGSEGDGSSPAGLAEALSSPPEQEKAEVGVQDTQEAPAIETIEGGAEDVEPVLETRSPSDVSPIATGKTVDELNGESTQPVLPIARPRRKKLAPKIVIPLLLLALSGTLIPAIMAINFGVGAYTTYTTLRGEAYDGIQHLLNVKTVFTGLKSHPTGFLDLGKLRLAQKEFSAAHKDFQQVQYTLDHAAVIDTVVHYLPQYGSQVISARAISQIGIEVTNIGQELIHSATLLAPTFRGPLLNATAKPLVTPAVLDLVRTTIDKILPMINDIQTQSHKFSLESLPANISAPQRAQLAQLLQLIPQAQTDLVQVRNLLDAAGWMLGVDQPRTFLVQTMDRAELRPTGGFTGQYGELSVNGGRVAPFSLKDISLVEYVDNSPTLGVLALPQYRSWWPFANWGLRDSNLSADFPTSAQIAITKYKSEVGHQVDGVIMFTTFLIEHILQVIGPIEVPGYNETITAQNLEERLHYYQLDNVGMAKQAVYQPSDTSTSSRKRFTSLLAQLLLDHIRHAPPDEILAIAHQLLNDLKTKDLQIYVTNPQVEAALVQFGGTAQIDRSTTHDGLYVVQANISASKASQFVRTIIHDTVTLNAEGGATHLMQMRLVYNQVGPVYGYDTYHDYVRVYVPPSSTYLWGDGFDTGVPLCGVYYPACPPTDVYPGHELQCPTGQSQPGAAAPSLSDEDGGSWHPLDTVGPPINFQSDEPGRAMFGGWVIVPKNCTMTVTLSWYVPPAGHTTPYTLLVQRQAGTFPELDLTILPSPGNCGVLKTAGQYFDGILGEDTNFALRSFPIGKNVGVGCYPQPGV